MNSDYFEEQLFIKNLTNILDENYSDEHFGVKKLSQKIGLSRSQLHRKINTAYNKSTSQIIKEYRLQKAIKILQDDVVTASEVAYKVGFNSPTYFNTTFRELFGYPPGEAKNKELPSSNINKIFDKVERIHSKKYNKKSFVLTTIVILIIIAFSYYFYTGSKTISPFLNGNKTIAVLPFKNLSNDEENQYFVDGIMGTILNHLSTIKDFKVISGITMRQYHNSTKTAPEIAKEVGASYLMEGSIQKHKDSIRISIQLIDAKKDEQIWSKHFERKYENIFALESEISILIASELKTTLSPIEIEQIEKAPTKNLEAYNLFLQAEYQKRKYNKVAFNNAIPLYEKATSLDSNFVAAYIGLSEIWITKGIVWGLHDEQKAWKKAEKLLLKAKSIDDTNKQIEHYLYMGYFYYQWNFKEVENYYQKELLESSHDYFQVFNVDYAIKTGRYQEALFEIDKFITTNPSIGYFYVFKAEILMFIGKKEEAKDLLNQSNSLHNDKFFYLRESAKLYFYLEAFKDSKIQLKKIRTKFPDENPPILIWLEVVLAHMDGNTNKEKLYLNQLINRYRTINTGSPAWFIALYYCHIKDYEKTFIWLQKSYDRHEVEMTWLREEPLLIPLQQDERYKDLYHKVGFSKIK